MWRLFYPLRYFRLANNEKRHIDAWPTLFFGLLLAAPYLLIRDAAFFGTGGFLDKLVPLMSALTGFYVAALVAAATFSHPDLDKTIHVGAVALIRPGYYLNRVEHAADLIAKAERKNVRIQFDFYHVQIVGGDLTRRFEAHQPVIGHVQVGAVPSRHEPDEGEVNCPEMLAMLDRLGYQGYVGAEYRPRGRTEDGLGWARPYGVIPK